MPRIHASIYYKLDPTHLLVVFWFDYSKIPQHQTLILVLNRELVPSQTGQMGRALRPRCMRLALPLWMT